VGFIEAEGSFYLVSKDSARIVRDVKRMLRLFISKLEKLYYLEKLLHYDTKF
jgi:hypothetical protein